MARRHSTKAAAVRTEQIEIDIKSNQRRQQAGAEAGKRRACGADVDEARRLRLAQVRPDFRNRQLEGPCPEGRVELAIIPESTPSEVARASMLLLLVVQDIMTGPLSTGPSHDSRQCSPCPAVSAESAIAHDKAVTEPAVKRRKGCPQRRTRTC